MKCVGCGADVVSTAALKYGAITGVYRCGGGYCRGNMAFLHQGAYRSPDSSLERTEAEKFVVGELGRFLADDQPYRVGVLLLSYTGPEGPDDTHIAGGLAMGDVNVHSAYDLVQMIKRLRGLADELDAMVQGKKPLPLQAGGDG